MVMSLVIPLFPCFGEDIAISFGTGALVTSIALIATGFTQGMRDQIAYYQEAIIVQMAGMGTGPAALAWLNDEPDSVFFALTILYGIVMAGYLFYTVAEQAGSSSPVIDCFLDEVSTMYGKTALKIANSIIIGVSLLLMAFVIMTRKIVNKARAHEQPQRYRRGIRWYRIIFVFIIFAAETVLAILINLTIDEYGKFVSSDDRAAISAWQFGQIIPLMMLLAPFMDVIRDLKDKFVEIRKKKAESALEECSNSSEGISVEKTMSGDIEASIPSIESGLPKLEKPVIKEVEVTESEVKDEVNETGKVETEQVERKEDTIQEDTSKE
jgi:hypothetical protein